MPVEINNEYYYMNRDICLAGTIGASGTGALLV